MRNMNKETNDLEPIDPRTARDLFLDHKAANCSEATVRNYRYRLKWFVKWCDEEELDNLNDLTGRHIQQFRLWRKETGDLNRLTMKQHMSTLRVFVKWAASIEAVSPDLYDKIMIPQVRAEERQRDETLAAEDAQEILDYLSKYRYGSKKHLLMAILWETGMRLGSVHSLDVDDVDPENRCLRLKHRPNKGTNLKNGKSGERPVAISPELTQVIEDYIAGPRPDVVDDYGRDPLLTSTHSRLSRTSMRRTVYVVTSPCYRGESCPGCEGESDVKCPEAVSPHAVRRGSITHYLSNDVPVEVVSDRMNVSRKVLNQHYDKRSEEVKLEQRRGYLDNV